MSRAHHQINLHCYVWGLIYQGLTVQSSPNPIGNFLRDLYVYIPNAINT